MTGDDSTAKPDPVPTAASWPFWQAARQGRLELQYCATCERYVHYPRAVCPRCLDDEALEWRTSTGRGTIYSYTVVHRPPSPAFDRVPYVVGSIELSEGPRLAAEIHGPLDDVAIGRSVEVAFEPRGEYSVPCFTLAQTARDDGGST